MTLAVAYQNFTQEARIATITTVAATLFFILPIIVMVCSFACLRLPGVSISYLKPSLVPAAGVLAASIPLIIISVLANRKKNAAFRPYKRELLKQVNAHYLPAKPTRAQKARFRRFVLEDLLNPTYSVDFRFFVLNMLTKEFSKNSSMAEQLEAAKESLLS
ncbi:MAG: hypothetical protein H7A36_05180 [Chlamydiales bacterium]|nr:hypothetical protein [Chlamydiales bacterium]